MIEAPRFQTLTELLDHAAARGGHIVHEGQTITYAQLRQRSQAAAAGLAALGLRRGDHIGLSMPNSPEWLVMLFACARSWPGCGRAMRRSRQDAEQAGHLARHPR